MTTPVQASPFYSAGCNAVSSTDADLPELSGGSSGVSGAATNTARRIEAAMQMGPAGFLSFVQRVEDAHAAVNSFPCRCVPKRGREARARACARTCARACTTAGMRACCVRCLHVICIRVVIRDGEAQKGEMQCVESYSLHGHIPKRLWLGRFLFAESLPLSSHPFMSVLALGKPQINDKETVLRCCHTRQCAELPQVELIPSYLRN